MIPTGPAIATDVPTYPPSALRAWFARMWGGLLVAAVLAGCDSSQPTASEMLQRGLRALENGDSEQAIAALTESLRLRPDDADAYYNRGLAHVRLGNFEAARKDYTAALRIRPEFPEAYTNRAVTYARRGRLDEAIADCTAAIDLNPADALAYRNRGLAHHDQRRYAAALADFNQALQLDNGLAEAYFNRAHTFQQLGEPDKAAADFAEAHRLDPQFDVPAEFTIAAPVAEDSIETAALPAPAVASAGIEHEVAPAPSSDDIFETVAELYRDEGFTVEPAEAGGAALICRQDGVEVKVLIKRVREPREAARLTADEVELAREPATRTDLVVLLEPAESSPPDAARIVNRLVDWNPEVEDLKPVEFELRPSTPGPARPAGVD